MTESAEKPDRVPVMTAGSWMFAWAGAAFLIALILAAMAMPSDVTSPEVSLTSTDIQLGQAIYNGEGCVACHSRMVRVEDRGMGSPASRDLMLATGADPGSSRIGPDLQNLDRRYLRSLLERRLANPASLQPGTVMPSYNHLRDSERAALISYLEQTVSDPGGLSAVRAKNNLEPSIPDQLLISLEDYFDSETGQFVPPIYGTPEFLITGSGIYNSRCAACHGIGGGGPISWVEGASGMHGDGSVALVPPADFTNPKYTDYSTLMFFWCISEGVPGTEMPKWNKTISRDAIWYLTGYVQSLVADRVESESEVDFPGIDKDQVLYPDWDSTLRDIETAAENIEQNTEPTDGASEEEGEIGNSDVISPDADGSVENLPTGEDSP